MAFNLNHYKEREGEVEYKPETFKVTNNNPAIRYHPYERVEDAATVEANERRVRFHTVPASPAPLNPLVEAIKKNIECYGGVIPKNNLGETNRIEPSCGVQDTLLRRAIRGSHNSDGVSPASSPSRSALLPATSESSLVYQPVPTRPIATSPVASPPAYTVELVSVAPGVQIQKKKFLPRYLPMPIGTPPTGLGRPILGRGALLYSLGPQQDMPSDEPQEDKENESHSVKAAPQSPQTIRERSSSAIGPRDYDILGAQLPKWPFSN